MATSSEIKKISFENISNYSKWPSRLLSLEPLDIKYFSKSFTVAEDVEINGAELKDGLLTISMERIIPEHKKARTINIK